METNILMTLANPKPSGDIVQAEHENSVNAKRTIDVVANSLVPSTYDYVGLAYSGSSLTGATFKTGGSGGTVVSTLLLAYDTASNLSSVTKL
jgi:hypothetical protein